MEHWVLLTWNLDELNEKVETGMFIITLKKTDSSCSIFASEFRFQVSRLLTNNSIPCDLEKSSQHDSLKMLSGSLVIILSPSYHHTIFSSSRAAVIWLASPFFISSLRNLQRSLIKLRLRTPKSPFSCLHNFFDFFKFFLGFQGSLEF